MTEEGLLHWDSFLSGIPRPSSPGAGPEASSAYLIKEPEDTSTVGAPVWRLLERSWGLFLAHTPFPLFLSVFFSKYKKAVSSVPGVKSGRRPRNERLGECYT